MSRKKFIKLVMCHGFSIREARSIAQYAQRSKIPYAEYYLSCRFALDVFAKRMAMVAKAIGFVNKQLNQTAQKIVCAAREQRNTKEGEA